MARVPAIVLVVAGIACACGTTVASSNVPPSCQTNADCRGGASCQFAVYGSCGAPGACIAQPDAVACVPQTACGCDGVTKATCLVNGNAPSPIASLGSCDGAAQPPITSGDGGADAALDVTPAADVADVQVVDAGEDASSIDTGADVGPTVDAADAGPPTLGTPCNVNGDCTDAYFNLCRTVSTGNKICTTTCFLASDCHPPASAFCDGLGYCEP